MTNTNKEEAVEEVHDMLDTLSTQEALRILHKKLTLSDLITLGIAIRRYGESEAKKALDSISARDDE